MQKVQLQFGNLIQITVLVLNAEQQGRLGSQYLFKHAAKYGDDVLDEELWVQCGG